MTVIEIPVVTVGGIQHPAEPIPSTALAVVCDGAFYQCAETPDEAAMLCPPPSPAGDSPVENGDG
ncbi:hypothetical protein [Azospirillum soli]|uniref:hypothetical protein n=1 Tax=Azospirillum soli TaxID=1304799 RepID=UPI001AE4CFF1|nr:hypothetical protein [Azospirillum soli]MBP2311894.1 hypothetical protein [Azospirillum soli]